jgi:geranylgeranyl transferase type-2 subunit beta
MTSYLDSLDKLLLLGVSKLSPEFVERHAGFAVTHQQPSGGFSGPMGGADLYYTDFGLRLARLLCDDYSQIEPTAKWITSVRQPTSILDCFSLLNSIRLLRDMGYETPVDKTHIVETIMAQHITDGGFGRVGSKVISGYNTFIAALCFEMLEMTFPDAEKAATAIQSLRQPDEGYSEGPERHLGQTNATSAAVAFLTMQNALSSDAAEQAAAFLASMQTADGGLLAHREAPGADLLSTFTGALTLFGLNAMDRLDLAGVARYAGSLALPDGGFAGHLNIETPDVEYTYYGVGALALLRAYLAAAQAG